MGCRRIGVVLLEVEVGGRGCLMIMIVIGCFFFIMWCFLRLLWIGFALSVWLVFLRGLLGWDLLYFFSLHIFVRIGWVLLFFFLLVGLDE